jgi:3-methyladenine DNA glycosylase AlkD
MSDLATVLQQLESKGSEQTRKIFARHGADPESMFGVKVADLKTIAKQIKGNQELALELYATSNSDAMYLAGIVADGSLMKKSELDRWAKNAVWHMISEYSVAGVAAENSAARDLAMKWIKAKKPHVAAAGWCTYALVMATRDDRDLDLMEIESLLDKVVTEIATAPNRVRYTMNGFVIAVGTYVKPLLKKAKHAAKKIGKVDVQMGDTACKVPLATEYIAKVEAMARVGKKRKSSKC